VVPLYAALGLISLTAFSGNSPYATLVVPFIPVLFVFAAIRLNLPELLALYLGFFALAATLQAIGVAPLPGPPAELGWAGTYLLIALTGGVAAILKGLILEMEKPRELMRLFNKAASATKEGIILTDNNNRVIWVNPAYTGITGYTLEEMLGKSPAMASSGLQPKEFYKDMFDTLAWSGHWTGEVLNRRKTGETYPQRLTVSAITDDHGAITNYIGLLQDVTRERALHNEVEHLANHDILTGLPNRHNITEAVAREIKNCSQAGRGFALLFVDLDRFKEVNDTLGHLFGDEVLKIAASRMLEVARKEDMVARLAGDEFIIILRDITDRAQAATIARRYVDQLSKPVVHKEHTVIVTPSVGITLYPTDGEDLTTLLAHSDTAMYSAKAKGSGEVCFYDKANDQTSISKLKLETEFRSALEKNELLVYYQPKVCVKTKRLVGVEALLRWNSPKLGFVGPDNFIPFAEESGLIVKIGEFVIREACKQRAAWTAQGILDFPIAVNLSSKQFGKDDLFDKVQAIMRETGVTPSQLEFEITETKLMAQPAAINEVLRKFKESGIAIAVDDFGTGYSSLAYLTKLPLTTLKIDRSFLAGVLGKGEDAAVCRAIADLAKILKLTVVAEGVETEGQADFLREIDCPFMQGYLISKPLSATDFVTFLDARQPRA
jgi:diguanylate cyclase (GGDEF)-like protein/PAS domain S-box-containing protein